MIQGDPASFYLDGQYEQLNPTWDVKDSQWKAAMVSGILERNRLQPTTVAEVGCGAGEVLALLAQRWPQTHCHGWDIAPGAARFWHAHRGVGFTQGDFLAAPTTVFDVVLLLDLIEHVANPHDFLNRLRPWARHLVLHIPLDLSVASVLRETPLLSQRRGVGHIHYFTRGLALDLLAECGYEIVECTYSGAHLRPRTGFGRLASLMRRIVFGFSRDVGVRLLGGDTLVVLARPKTD